MEHATTASSAHAAQDPDRQILQSFENPPISTPITVVATDPAGLSVTFCLHGHDHTIGNALRWQLMRYDEVSFCGYTMPHPSEAKVHVRVQVAENIGANINAVGLLRRALTDLKAHYARIRGELGAAFDSYKEY